MLLRYFYILFVLRLNMCISSAALREKNITWYLFFNAQKNALCFVCLNILSTFTAWKVQYILQNNYCRIYKFYYYGKKITIECNVYGSLWVDSRCPDMV